MVRFSLRSRISKNGAASTARAACLAIMAIIGADSSTYAKGKGDSGPPLKGTMKKFEPTTIRPPALETVFMDENGNELTLRDFRGRVVLLNFWATWCGPCVREMPSLRYIHNKLKGPDFLVIALSEDRQGWKKIRPFRDKLNLGDLPLYHDAKSKMMFASKALGLPTTILIGRDGKELGRLTGFAEWDTDEAIALLRYYIGGK